MEPLEELILAAHKEIEVDLLLEGADIVNTLSGELYRSDVAVHKGRVTGFDCLSAREVLDLSGSTLAPGFVDGHVHIESAMVTVPEYARAVVPRGTTTVVTDPHEIANVMGAEGVFYMLDSARNVPLNVYVMLPSCVPATTMETSGAVLDADALSGMVDTEGVLGIAEMMNYPGVIFRDPEVLKKIRLAGSRRVDGHSPLLTGENLAAYIAAGIGSDHECTSLEEAGEKLRLGMHIMIREGTAAKNLREILPLVTAQNARRFLFVSDDRHGSDILREGHIDFMIKTAVLRGTDPILALQIATLNAALYFGVLDLGAIAPGYRADMVVLDGLDDLSVEKVFKDGRLVAQDGRLLVPVPTPPVPRKRSMQIGAMDPSTFEIRAEETVRTEETGGGLVRVIGLVPNQIITRSLLTRPVVQNGMVVSDPENDVLKMAVVERHRATGNVGLGLVQGFGLKRGAIATSVAHDSHNVAVVGVSSEDMHRAVKAVEAMGGGLVAVDEGRVRASLPLPIAGLLSDWPMMEVVDGIDEVVVAAHTLGSGLEDPFMTLSFLALPVIPELKLTDRGLVDVTRFDFVPLYAEEAEVGEALR